ncbi:alpha-glucuronidase [Eubacterium xylanophilum]|uniref:alpha-glucuronidase n=1 Tax=Eubacterium xylanophilum TaxID=39497 RepID=UPI0004AE8635|nr:alpha-glucuronidase [Eubacterium xylanophilum]
MFNSTNYTKCWLNYKAIDAEKVRECFANVILMSADRVAITAAEEYCEHMGAMLDAKIEYSTDIEYEPAVCLQVEEDDDCDALTNQSFYIEKNEDSYAIVGKSGYALLQGVYAFLRMVYLGDLEKIDGQRYEFTPSMPLRIVNHWDDMDGSIERGYSGRSFFYDNYEMFYNDRVEYYAKLMASIGINAIVINNVNVHQNETYLITDRYLEIVRKYSDLFGKYGMKLFLSVNFAAPMELGNLEVSDPLDSDVCKWWEKAIAHVYEVIPEFGGFLVKADSEGRPGPFTYGRTHADGANMLARELKKYGGLVIWRCFVYNCGQDWRDTKTDRARAAYDHFMELDGTFDDNVILQIKNGPMDFQVREPVSPMFGGLKKTNMMLEVQIAQEYTGQQIDLCYLIPMWKEILEFDTFAEGEGSTVEKIVSGKAYGNKYCGMAGVINTGDDENWTGNELAAANLYGYGRLAMDPSLSAEDIAREWIRFSISKEDDIVDDVAKLLGGSWATYEKYNAPLGIGWMVTPHYHYGPDIDGYEYDRWGTYHRADLHGIGVDRTDSGTGYVNQYNEPWRNIYADRDRCPEELILFFHHLPYTYELKTGKTVIQYIYDTHFEGVEEVREMIGVWKNLEGRIDRRIYDNVLERFERQLNNAIEWRDRVNTYFYRKCGIDDAKNRKIFR